MLILPSRTILLSWIIQKIKLIKSTCLLVEEYSQILYQAKFIELAIAKNSKIKRNNFHTFDRQRLYYDVIVD